MSRNNETWLMHLGKGHPDQQAALSALRAELLRSLRRAFWKWGLVDEAFLEDAVQDGLVRILDRLQQFEGRSRFLTWATAIAIRVAMTELRRRRWQDVSLDTLSEDPHFAQAWASDEEIGPAVQWEQQAILDTLHDVMQNELTDKQRTALVAELKGMPQEEIARHIGSNRNAVYKLTHDARKRLKRGLEAAGYVAADIHAAFVE
ncbi:MAG TPA: RNA polymerase sigma factor [Gammaproteobacteria bacterium]|nr:RNA polymerase sigma factor [Gammaproteobacteria bacterium]